MKTKKTRSKRAGMWNFPKSLFAKPQMGLTGKQVAEMQQAVSGTELVTLGHLYLGM